MRRWFVGGQSFDEQYERSVLTPPGSPSRTFARARRSASVESCNHEGYREIIARLNRQRARENAVSSQPEPSDPEPTDAGSRVHGVTVRPLFVCDRNTDQPRDVRPRENGGERRRPRGPKRLNTEERNLDPKPCEGLPETPPVLSCSVSPSGTGCRHVFQRLSTPPAWEEDLALGRKVADLPRPVRDGRRQRGQHETSYDPYLALCPYAMFGECRYGSRCVDIHGLKCEFCGIHCLNPYVPEQRKFHRKECVKRHEENMKISFRIAVSKDKACGICFDVVAEKQGKRGDRRFGILPSCTHVFCLVCIRKWRQQKNSFIDKSGLKACPSCRTPAEHVIPSKYWIDDEEEKKAVLEKYKKNMQKKHCKYFGRGAKACPFGNKCFYRHELRDGTRVDVGPPKRRSNRTCDERTPEVVGVRLAVQRLLWDFMDHRELRNAYLLEIAVMRRRSGSSRIASGPSSDRVSADAMDSSDDDFEPDEDLE